MTEVAELPGLLEDLQHCNKQLDVVEKGKRALTLTRAGPKQHAGSHQLNRLIDET